MAQKPKWPPLEVAIWCGEPHEYWCRLKELNPRPSHYKCAALPTELTRRFREMRIIRNFRKMLSYFTIFNTGFLLFINSSLFSMGFALSSTSPSETSTSCRSDSASKNIP